MSATYPRDYPPASASGKLQVIDYNAISQHVRGETSNHEKGISYIIRKNGSNYEAIDGSTGKLAFTPSTNASSIHQQAFDAGGSVLTKNGTYTFNDPVNVKSSTRWIGESLSETEIVAAAGFTGAALITQTDINTALYWVCIRNLNLNGNKTAVTNATMDGIRLKCGQSFIEYNYIHDFKRNGIYNSATVVGPPPNEPDNRICDNYLYNNGSYGAYLSCTDQHFSRNEMYYNNIGVYGGTSAIMSDNHAYSNTTAGYEVGEGSVLTNCESETGVTGPPMGQLYGFAINECSTKPVSLIGCWGFNMTQLVRFNGNVGSFLMVGCRSMNHSVYAVYVPTNITVTNLTFSGCMFHTGSNGATYNINNGGTITNLAITGSSFVGNALYNSGAPISDIATHITGAGNIGCNTEYVADAALATASTWTFTPNMLGGGDNAPSPKAVSISFDGPVEDVYWGYAGTTLTIYGTPTNAETQCYIKAIYQK